MSLVSSIYRMAPNEPASVSTTPWEDQHRLQVWIERLVRQFGGAEVRKRIRESSGDPVLKARLLLLAFTGEEW